MVADWFQSQPRILDRIGPADSGNFIDSLNVITPKFGLTVDKAPSGGDAFQVLRPKRLTGADTPRWETVTTVLGEGTVADVAMAPGGTTAPYLVEGDNRLWQLDLATGERSVVATVPHSRAVAVGGAEQTRYVLARKHLWSFDPDGHRKQAPLDEALADIVYDDDRSLLVGITERKDALVAFDDDLRAVARTPLPSLGCPNSASLLYDRSTGSVLVHCDGSARIERISGRGAREVVLEGATDVGGVGVDDTGHLFATVRGALVEYSPTGQRVEDSDFTGLPGRGSVEILRSFDNWDPETMTGPPYHNVLPQDA